MEWTNWQRFGQLAMDVMDHPTDGARRPDLPTACPTAALPFPAPVPGPRWRPDPAFSFVILILILIPILVLLAPGVASAQPAANPSGASTREVDPTHATETRTNAVPIDAGSALRVRDFVDTRLTWTFGDDDVSIPSEQRFPLSPLPRIGDRPQYRLFFDALNSRFAGRENLTHLVLHARAPGFIPRIVTEASLVVRLDLTQLATGSDGFNQVLYDAGSFIRVLYQTDLEHPGEGLSFTFFPFDTDRFRLGYLWDLSWGGNDIFPRRTSPTPGLRVGFDRGPFSAFAGFKTASVPVPVDIAASTGTGTVETAHVNETQYGGLGGVGYRFGDWGRLDVSGGFFQQGRLDLPGVNGKQVLTFGGSARLVVNHNLTPATSVDMLLYRNDPNFPFQIFAQETYIPGQLSWLGSVEVTALGQRLADAQIPGRTAIQPALAGAVQGRVKYGYWGFTVTGLYRNVPFLRREVPSLIPFQTLPTDADVSPEYFVALAADYRIAAANLLPAIVAGVQLPAAFSTTVTEGMLQSQRSLVIHRDGSFSLLRLGASAAPVFSARLSTRWDLSSIFAAIVWAQYVRDSNSTVFQTDDTGSQYIPVATDPNHWGFGITAQARF